MTQNLGFVETPEPVATCIAHNLIHSGRNGRILYPGLGRGRIRDAVVEVAQHRNVSLEEVGVERDETRVAKFDDAHPDADVAVHHADFLLDPPEGPFEYVVMNPPYVRHSEIPDDDRAAYEERLELASGKYDLYHLFVEQALDLLAPDGVLVAIVPTTWYQTQSGADFRELVRAHAPFNHFLVPDDAFDAMVSTCIFALPKTPEIGPSLNLSNPHPYDVMDLQECCTFDDDYRNRVHSTKRKLRRVVEDDPAVSGESFGDGSDGEQADLQQFSEAGRS